MAPSLSAVVSERATSRRPFLASSSQSTNSSFSDDDRDRDRVHPENPTNDSQSEAKMASSTSALGGAAAATATTMAGDAAVTESSADESTAVLCRVTSRDDRGFSVAGSTSGATRRGESNRRDVHPRGRQQPEEEEEEQEEEGMLSRSKEKIVRWWTRLVERYGAIELDNKGSVARDHLALERTFLAWLRTSLAFASIGIAVAQLFRLNTVFNNESSHQPQPHLHSRSHSQLGHPISLPSSDHHHPSSPLLALRSSAHSSSSSSSSPSIAIDSARAHRLARLGKPLGVTFLAISIVVLIIGSNRFFESQAWLMRGKFPASRFSIFVVTVIAGALIVGSLVLIVIVDPTISNHLS